MSLYDTINLWRTRGKHPFAEGLHMPTVAVEGQFRFVVNTKENSFEPPHVHVWVGNEDVCRIELNGGSFMDTPPPGNFRNIMRAYARYTEEIRRVWDAIHGG